jgi:thymidylate synthase (FAD)
MIDTYPGIHKVIKVLDKGHVELVDVMGSDEAIVQAARVSYGEGTRTVREDRGLIDYLMRHRHTSPFEMAVVKFHVKAPLFVVRQWQRHRMASYNEVSGRYSEMTDEFYFPDPSVMAVQSAYNRQGRGDVITPEQGQPMVDRIAANSGASYEQYKLLLDAGVSREIARMVLPLNTYTRFYWQTNLHNFFHFYKLRADPHAQWEIQQYAEAMGEIVADYFPLSWQSYLEHVYRARTFSERELAILKVAVNAAERPPTTYFASASQEREFYEKLGLQP